MVLESGRLLGRVFPRPGACASTTTRGCDVGRSGITADGNLQGTIRTLDGALGEEQLKELIGAACISRDGWVVVDDAGPLFASSDFNFSHGDATTQPWVLPQPPGTRQDLYF